jgi:hypothetical protein
MVTNRVDDCLQLQIFSHSPPSEIVTLQISSGFSYQYRETRSIENMLSTFSLCRMVLCMPMFELNTWEDFK